MFQHCLYRVAYPVYILLSKRLTSEKIKGMAIEKGHFESEYTCFNIAYTGQLTLYTFYLVKD